MDKQDILNYVTETPGNTNRAVLGSMLDSMGGGSSSQPLIVHLTTEDGLLFTFDKTFGEIYDAIQAGQIVVLASSYSDTYNEITQNAIIINVIIEHQTYEEEKYYGYIIVSLTPYNYTAQLGPYYAEGDTLTELRADYPYYNFSD